MGKADILKFAGGVAVVIAALWIAQLLPNPLLKLKKAAA